MSLCEWINAGLGVKCTHHSNSPVHPIQAHTGRCQETHSGHGHTPLYTELRDIETSIIELIHTCSAYNIIKAPIKSVMKSTETTADRKWPIKLNTQYLPNTIKGLNLNHGTHIQHPSPLLDTRPNDFCRRLTLWSTSLFITELYFLQWAVISWLSREGTSSKSLLIWSGSALSYSNALI